ncbi:MAG: MlaE family lipid ABC transporter permease subunit [Thermodesulfobacteriota bacterium]
MKSTANPPIFGFNTETPAPGKIKISFSGQLVIHTAAECIKSLTATFKAHPVEEAEVDIGEVTRMDEYGAMVLSELKAVLGLNDTTFRVVNACAHHQKMLVLMDFDRDTLCDIAPRPAENLVVHAGEATLSILNGIGFFIAFIGSITLSCLRIVGHPRSFRANDTISHMKSTGVDALPVVGLISLLLGLILAFMSSLQLEQYGATMYVASLVTMAMVSELGPIMTAIVVAGRSGSAYAAEISTMKISEEIDGLYVMGFDPNQFLVIPRLIAALIVIPLLTVFSILFSTAGGMMIGIFKLNITPDTYINQSIAAITLFELNWGLFKSAVFAVLIAVTGCLRGFQARGGAAAVGNAATSAVVTSIFLIILFDSLFAIIRSYWG